MKIVTALAAIPLSLSLLACGGDDPTILPPDGSPIDAPRIDAPMQANCQATASYGAVTANPETTAAYWDGGTAQAPEFAVGLTSIAAGPPADGVQIELYAGFGALSGGIVPDTYTITGDELNYATCGVCVTIQADITQDAVGSVYMATGGSVTINSISPTFSATASNLTFEHVTIDPQTFQSTPVGDGCNSSITSVAIDATLEPLPQQ
ncbi:MAG: hypothetical protein R2939_06990 [Kofleriaceae bacterium]